MIVINNVSKHYGRRLLLVEASFQLNPGDKVGLVGPNGSGKSTLFRLIVGEEQPDDGEVGVPKRTTIGYFRQDAGEMSGRSVLDEAIAGSGRLGDLHHELTELEHALGDPARAEELDAILARFGEVQGEYQQLGGYDLEARAKEVLHGLGFHDEQISGDVGALSGGWRMRVSIAKVLIGKPDVLLLDEPTNHLDIESILWLEQFLVNSEAAVLMTCHDRDFMNRVVRRTVEIAEGQLVEYGGNYDFYDRERAVRAREQEAAYARQQAMLKKEERFIERFERHVAKAAQVQSRIKKLDKIDKLEPPRKREVVALEFRTPPRSGNDVATLAGICKRYGERAIYERFDFEVKRGERWCVMGQNGAGKTTLLKLVAGVIQPDQGTVKLGASLKLGYFAQSSLEILDPTATVWEQIDRAFPLATTPSKRSLLGAFDFPGDEIDKRIGVLSGGERSRLVLAQMLFDPPNFLVLDEPTNHLDLLTKEMLVKTLANFDGTMLFVSHDRTFLKGLATKVLDLSGGGDEIARKPLVFHSSYDKWVEMTGHEAPGVH
ncbi:MAG: ABC-F family ATP-binding cassette domain-containing protein, partial [Planctomycetes bacterium]|nr:ABC-F family ATP-binding cassette domain-containing protein [Planctomycetota bacterium]